MTPQEDSDTPASESCDHIAARSQALPTTQLPCSAPSGIPGTQRGPHGGIPLRLAGMGKALWSEVRQHQAKDGEREHTKDRGSWRQLQANSITIQTPLARVKRPEHFPRMPARLHQLEDLAYEELLHV